MDEAPCALPGCVLPDSIDGFARLQIPRWGSSQRRCNCNGLVRPSSSVPGAHATCSCGWAVAIHHESAGFLVSHLRRNRHDDIDYLVFGSRLASAIRTNHGCRKKCVDMARSIDSTKPPIMDLTAPPPDQPGPRPNTWRDIG